MKYVNNICVVLLVIFSQVLIAQDWAAAEEQISLGMKQTISNQFDDAEQTFNQIIDAFPQHPGGYFYLGAAVQARMLDAESYQRMSEFDSLMERTVQLAQLARSNQQQPSAMFFYEGSAHLYRSFMASKQKKYWRAYRTAVKGVDLLEKAIEVDNNFYDAYLGVGSFRFWKSEKAGALTWLPFVSDEREEGISMVRKAITHGRFVPLVARDQLAWILLAAEQRQEALELARANHLEFPESRFFLWTLAEVTYKMNLSLEAEQLFLSLLAEIRKIPNNNHYSEIGILLKLAELAQRNNNFEHCNAFVNEILVLNPESDVRKKVQAKIKRAVELKEMCARELAELGK